MIENGKTVQEMSESLSEVLPEPELADQFGEWFFHVLTKISAGRGVDG